MRAGTVLIVEDEDNATALEIALAALGEVTVQVVPDLDSALSVLECATTQLVAVVTDLNLGQATGYELMTAIRRHSRYTKLPIVVVSGSGQWETPDRVREAGADAYFAKPYSPLEVRQKLEELLHAA